MQLELDFARPPMVASDARIFLGWDRPALRSITEHLLRRAPPHDRVIDLQGVLVAMPSARAGRRLLALMVEESERRQRGLLPPRIVTLGALPECLYTPRRPLAAEEECVLAWLDAMAGSPEACAVLAVEPSTDLARVALRMHAALAAERRGFGDAARAAESLDADRMQRRLVAWEAIFRRYLERLDAIDRDDVFAAREAALCERRLACDAEVVLCGAPDIPGQTLAMLHALERRPTAMVFAPAALARRFDEDGRIVVPAWLDARIELDEAQMTFVETAREQALAARDAIAELGESYALDEVVVGVLDEEIRAPIAETLASEGVATHAAAGRPFAESSVSRLLSISAAAASQVQGGVAARESEAFCAWVRHPEVCAALDVRPRER